MKFLLLLIVVGVLLWLLRGSWRRARPPRAESKPAGTRKAADDAPQPMLSCAHCGLHLPRDEALPGRGGMFCGAPHREAFERAHPES